MWYNQFMVWKDQVTSFSCHCAQWSSSCQLTVRFDHGLHFLATLSLVSPKYPLCLPYLPSPPDPSLPSPRPNPLIWANMLVSQLPSNPNLFLRASVSSWPVSEALRSLEDTASNVAASNWCLWISGPGSRVGISPSPTLQPGKWSCSNTLPLSNLQVTLSPSLRV